MVPFLAHGHISPFLELAKKLSKKNFTIYFCSTPINLTSIKPKLADKSYPSIHLIDLHLPSLPQLPPHYHTTNGLPPHLMPLLVQAFQMAGPSFINNILEKIKPNLIIYDMFQPWVDSITVSHGVNIPGVHFIIAGAAAVMLGVCHHLNVTNPFPAIHFREPEIKKLMEGNDSGVKDVIFKGLDGSCEIVLVRSCHGMDGKYMDFLSKLCKKKVISVGPLLVRDDDDDDNDDDEDHIFEWLKGKEESSTLFVSFGSENFLSKDEIKEVAHGLESSNVNFIWVIRVPKGEKIDKVEEILPKGYLERVKGRGKIVFGWAPQARILKHPNIGGFVSHCGWSSIIESLSFGVPIIAMPLQHDQPLNARMVVELGVAMEVSRNDNGELEREEVAKAIREVVVEKSGEDVRKKARKLGEGIRVRGDEDIDGLVEELKKLCHKYNKED